MNTYSFICSRIVREVSLLALCSFSLYIHVLGDEKLTGHHRTTCALRPRRTQSRKGWLLPGNLKCARNCPRCLISAASEPNLHDTPLPKSADTHSLFLRPRFHCPILEKTEAAGGKRSWGEENKDKNVSDTITFISFLLPRAVIFASQFSQNKHCFFLDPFFPI